MRSNTTVSCVAVILLAFALFVVPRSPVLAADVKTSKERLSDKGSDEQRVDNCRVPLERRGTTPRPGCPKDMDATAPVATQGAGGDPR